jgi:hypothetical protein
MIIKSIIPTLPNPTYTIYIRKDNNLYMTHLDKDFNKDEIDIESLKLIKL